MNYIYRIVWNACKGTWQVVSECTSGRAKASTTRSRNRRRAAVLALVAASGAALAADPLPTGGRVVAGQASIQVAGQAMTINQTTAKAALDWTGFSVGQGHTVNFVQPSSSSVALNRVLGADPSVIQGALKANGHVFLINPNGVLFGPTAQVNVGGLLASTLSMSNEDFLAGRYHLSGASGKAVENQGSITAAAGGSIALVAARVSNAGQLAADSGNVLLGAGSDVLVDFGGAVKLQVQKGALDALVENGGAIRADGGTVLLTARSASELSGSVINNSGIVQARTLATGEQGKILLLGDMQTGRLQAGGILDASAPQGGNGGFIETSAAHVDNAAGLVVNAGAANGTGGQWLIDPYDYTINGASASTIVNSLNQGTSVTVSTQASTPSYGGATTTGNGDITVASPIAKTAGGDATLTLRADRNIIVNSDITSTSGKLNLTLSSANAAGATIGGVDINANLKSNGGNILVGGGNGDASTGVGYALNLNTSSAGVVVEQARSILSSGGNITINGRSLVGSSSGSYGGTTGGVYIKSNATILSGTGNLLVNGESKGGSHTFGIAFEGNSNTVTTLGSATGGGTMLLNAVNVTPGATAADLNAGAIGMVSYGNRDRIQFQGPSVANWLVYVNGAPQLSAYTQSPQLSSCATPYPNCGTMVVPGSNNSYLYATYRAVNMSTLPIYMIQTGAGTKVYDANTTATGLSYTIIGAPTNFTVANLNPNPVFYTGSKNVGAYNSLTPDAANPVNYTAGATTYAVGYFSTGSYTITPKSLTPAAANKVYDGNTTAAVTLSGAIAGDAVTASGTGSFAGKNVGTYAVSIGNITLGGADAGNYTLSGNAASATASITPRTVTLSASKTYDGSTSLNGITIGNLVAGETLYVSGATANSANVASARYIDAITLGDGFTGMASNYQLPSLSAASAANAVTITPKALSIGGLAVADKVYDGTTMANVSGGILSGLVGDETLGISTLAGAFADKNVGAGKSVTLSSVSLSDGTGLASNYTFSQPTGLTGAITPKALSVSGITASDKVYDGTTAAIVNAANASLNGLVAGDDVSVSATGAFADKNAGSGKTVSLSSSFGGADAANYAITGQASTAASITPKALGLTGLGAASKTYDGTTAATLTGGTLSGLVDGETLDLGGLTGTFADKNAGASKSVLLSGGTLLDGTGLASNYSLGVPASVTASIYQKALGVSGITAADKVYDGSTAAAVNAANAVFNGLVAGDDVSVSATGAFADKNAGNGKAVALTSNIGGADAANYAITNQGSTTASITPKALSLTGLGAASKTYDGTTAATLTGGTLTGLVGGETLDLGGLTGTFADKNAGASKSVTVGGQVLDGTGLVSNYSLTVPASVTASIYQKALMVSGITAADKVYDGSTAATVNAANASFNGLVAGDVLTVSATGTFADKNAGNGKTVALTSNIGGADAGNYAITSQTSTTASITPKALTVSGITAADKVYDGSTSAAVNAANANLNGLVTGDVVTVSATGAFADKNAGNGKTVALTSNIGGADAGNYAITSQGSTTASITPKALTVSGITAADKVYDGSTSANVNVANASFNGLVAGDDVSVSATGAFANKNAGNGKTVALNSNIGGNDASNYAITNQASTTASITPKALTVSGITAADKVYDGSTSANVNAANTSFNGLVAGDDVSVSATGAFANKNAGSGKTVALTSNIAGADAGNYAITSQASTTASITPKALSVSGITAADKVYDGSTAATVNAANASFNGLVAGDVLTVSATGTFADKNAGNGKTVALTSNIGGADAGNYAITSQGSTTASITPKALTVSGITAADKVYDGSTSANVNVANASFNGLVAGDVVTVSVTGAFANKNAGNGKTVALTSNTGGADAGNYAITNQISTTASITPKALTVSGITGSDKVYDGSTAATVNAANASFNGLVAGDDVSVSATGAFADKNAGNGKSVALTSNIGGNDASNYAITNQASTTASITPKALTASGITAADKAYDGSTAATVNAANASFNGLVAGDDVTVSATGTFADKNAGNGKTVALTSNIGGADAGNYAITSQGSTTASITPKALTVSGITAADKVYDGSTSANVNVANASFNGLVAGDDVSVSATGAFANKNAGNGKTVALNSNIGGNDASNYAITNQSSTTASITPKALTVSGITAADKVYDGSTAATVNAANASFNGLVAGDDVTVSATGAFVNKNAGNGKTVALTSNIGGNDAGNYAITNQAGTTASITPKALTVSGITAADKVYDGSTAATVNAANASFNGLVAGDDLSVSATGAFANKNAGNGKTVALNSNIGGADAGNYAITNQASTTASITPKALSVSGITASDKVYDGSTAATVNAANASFNGLVAGDDVSVSAMGAFANKNAGNGKTVALTSNIGGADAGNYAITNQISTTASITPKALTVSGITAADKVYDGSTAATVNAANTSFNGLVAGDDVSVSATGAFANKNAGSGKTVALTSNIAGADAGNYAITSQASTTASITPKALSVSGITASDKVYDGSTAATVNAANASFSGLVAGDDVSVSATGAFANKNAGNGKTVALTSNIGGADAGNYAITNQASTTASITPKALSLTGLGAASKTYDGTTSATLTGGTLAGLVGNETVSVDGLTGAFADKNAGANKTVTVSGGRLADGTGLASNYSLTVPASVTASIGQKALTVSGITAADKVYDGSTSATVSAVNANLNGLVTGDVVTVSATGAFADKNAGNGKTVALTSNIGGADAVNYAITSQGSATATITPKALTVSGATVADKTADGSTAATLKAPGTLVGVIASDSVGLNGSGATAQFVQAAPGTNVAVNVSGLALSGIDAGNYAFAGTTSASGTILPAATPTPTPTPAPTPVPTPAPSTASAVATAIAPPQNQGIVSVLQAPAMGGMSYLAVPEQGAAPAAESSSGVSATERRQASTQALGAGRDVKFLDVLVVSGGIRMPAAGKDAGEQ